MADVDLGLDLALGGSLWDADWFLKVCMDFMEAKATAACSSTDVVVVVVVFDLQKACQRHWNGCVWGLGKWSLGLDVVL